MTVPAQARPHADGLITMLTDGGLTVGDADGAGLTAPYAVLYTDEGVVQGTLGDRHRDLLVTAQVTAVGTTREQAQWVQDKARSILLGGVPTVPGRVVHPLWQFGSQPVSRDDDVTPPLFYATDQYRLRSQPA